MKKIICLVAILFTLHTAAIACKCAEHPAKPKRKEFKATNRIFTGKVIAVKDTAFGEIKVRGEGRVYKAYTFEVLGYYKGKKTEKTITIITGQGGGDCGYVFTLGQAYTVHATMQGVGYFIDGVEQQQLFTNSCSYTQVANVDHTKLMKRYFGFKKVNA